MHPAIIIRTVRSLWNWLWGRYHAPQNVFLVIIIIVVVVLCCVFFIVFFLLWLSDLDRAHVENQPRLVSAQLLLVVRQEMHLCCDLDYVVISSGKTTVLTEKVPFSVHKVLVDCVER